MLIEISKFYLECLKRAFKGKFWIIEKWAGGLALLGLIVTQFFKLPEQTETMIEVSLPVYGFLFIFGVTVLVGLLAAPYEIFAEEREKRFILEKEREPRFSFFIPDSYRQKLLEKGGTQETLSGQRQTIFMGGGEPMFCVALENLGDQSAVSCQAFLKKVWKVEEDNRIDQMLIEPIQLSMSPTVETSLEKIDIPSGSKRRIWIARCAGSKGYVWVHRDVKTLPMDAQQIFGEPGIYEALIQVTAENSLPSEFLAQLSSSPAEKPKSGFWTPKIEITILKQGSPKI